MTNNLYQELNSTVNDNHNPDIQYYLIKQNIQNLNEKLLCIDSCIDEESIRISQKIDIFRGIMQYTEEFLLYFLAKSNKDNVAVFISKTMPSTIIDFLGYYKKGEVDDYASKLRFKDFYSLLSDVFQVDNVNNESLSNIKNTLDKITYFFYFYKDMYNSIKHGSRAFQQSFSHFDLFFDGEPDYKQRIFIDEKYIKFICKKDDSIYPLIYPLNALLEDSILVLEDVREIFNFLRKTNKYKDSCLFDYASETTFSKYLMTYNGKASIFLPYSNELNEFVSSPYMVRYCQFNISKNKIYILLSQQQSYEFPFQILIKNNKRFSTRPDLFDVKYIRLVSSIEPDIKQMRIIREMNNLINSDLDYTVIFKENDKEVFKDNSLNMNFPDIFLDFDEHALEILILLEKILQIEIPVPFSLSDEHYKLLESHASKFDKKEEASKFLEKLKSKNISKLNFFLNIIDENENLINEKVLGYTFDLGFLKIGNVDIFNNYGSFEISDKSDGTPFKFFDLMAKKLNNNDDLSDISSYHFLNKISFASDYHESFWFKEFTVIFTIIKKEESNEFS